MKDSRETIEGLLDRFGSPLYVFDESGFAENYRRLNEAMSSLYGKYRIAYSFKTNYTPYICSVAKGLGAYAEVVSEMEYRLAQAIGYEERQIVFNGPDKGPAGVEAFLRGCIVNADSLDELETYCAAAEEQTDAAFTIGIRVNLDVGQGFVSRFGMDESDVERAFRRVSRVANLKIAGLHCHISRCRGEAAWRRRTEFMLELADRFFDDPPAYIDLGSGMFGSMAPDFAAQFENVPTYEEYARATAGVFADHYRGQDGPYLFTEPGTTLVNRFVDCVARVQSVKSIKGRFFAVLDASEHTLGETCTLKKLPVTVIPGGAPQMDYDAVDLTGYTCLEQDVLFPAYQGKLAVGDYVVFGNTGGYSTVLKPPFIRPGCAMIAEKPDGDYKLIKRAETFDDIFRTYLFEDGE
jgi:diaminopimelate decarboxylase